MVKSKSQPLPADIESLRARLEKWRQSGTRSKLIPEPLWDSATRLARKHGIHRIARALRLDYYGLKRRAKTADSSGEREELPTAFVEVGVGPSIQKGECSIELEKRDKAKITIRLSGAHPREVAKLANALLELE